MADFISDRGGDLLIARQIPPQNLDIERSRESEVNGLADNVRRQKIKGRTGKLAVERETQSPHKIGRRLMSSAE